MEIGKIYTVKEIKDFLSQCNNVLLLCDKEFMHNEMYNDYKYKVINFIESKVVCHYSKNSYDHFGNKTILELKYIQTK